MFAQPPAPRRLAVATLSEAGDAAAVYSGPDGRPLQGYVLMTGEGPDCQITVYIERGPGQHTAVLAGEMVWFQTPPEAAQAPRAEMEPNPEPEPQPAPQTEPEPEPEPEPEREPAEVGFKLYPEPATPVSAIIPHKIEVTVTPVAEPPADKPPADAPVPGEREPLAVTLTSRHPLAPRAGGSARLDPTTGRLVLNVRGLPSPAALNRSSNAYRAWLLSQRAGTRHDLGLLTRLWGENFRLESEPGLPLDRFDAVLVTAEDRSARGAAASAPQVLLGTYVPQ